MQRSAALNTLKSAREEGKTSTMPETGSRQVYQVFIRATPAEVWKAVTSPEFTKLYFNGPTIEVTEYRCIWHGVDAFCGQN